MTTRAPDPLNGFPSLLAPEHRFTQEHDRWCGAAALQCVLAKYGTRITQEEIADRCEAIPEGITIMELKRVARELGFEARGYIASHVHELLRPLHIGIPPIAYLQPQGRYQHYGVVCGTVEDRILLHDPAPDHRYGGVLPISTFARYWFSPNGAKIGGGISLLVMPRTPSVPGGNER